MSSYRERVNIQIQVEAGQTDALRVSEDHKGQLVTEWDERVTQIRDKFWTVIDPLKDFEEINADIWEGRGEITTTNNGLVLRTTYPINAKGVYQRLERRGFGLHQIEVAECTSTIGAEWGHGGSYVNHPETRFGRYIIYGSKLTGYETKDTHSELSLEFSVAQDNDLPVCILRISDTETAFEKKDIKDITDCPSKDYIFHGIDNHRKFSGSALGLIEHGAAFVQYTERANYGDAWKSLYLQFAAQNFDKTIIRRFLESALTQSCKSRIANPLSMRIFRTNAEIEHIKSRIGQISWNQYASPSYRL
ncbi:MAG TPA: hypothetical protein VMR77_03970 [Patescibacteria group bacterium]|nr:hypothetical protein [Patescibacteria group bacterium]